MSREKQIEEMAREIYENTDLSAVEVAENIAEHLYTAGYHKQEWISVEDRLPEPNTLVLCRWLKYDHDSRYGFATYQHHGAWYVSNEGMPRVTHWMPLPEPPKGE